MLLPTLGKPIKPTSAKVFNSKITECSFVVSPVCEKCGACLVGDLKKALPFPPSPPFNKT